MELSWLKKQNSRTVLVFDERKHWHCLLKVSVIIAKKGIAVKEIKPITTTKNRKGQALEIIDVNLETPTIGNLWILNVYNSTNQELNINEIFNSNLQNMLICGDFNSPHQELNCTNNTEKSKKNAGKNWWRKLQTTEQRLSNLSI